MEYEVRVRKAVIPAAGLGTRFLPATKAIPKELLPIIDRPAIHLIVEEAVRAGIDDILIITGRNKRALEDYFDRAPEVEQALQRSQQAALARLVRRPATMADIHFVNQPEPLGLGHAISLARRHVGHEPFAVLLPDVLVQAPVGGIGQLLPHLRSADGGVIAVHEVTPGEVERYGVVALAEKRRHLAVGDSAEIVDLVEKPEAAAAPSHLAITGRYILPGETFDALAETPPGKNGEVQLTDALRRLLRSRPLRALALRGRVHDIGNPAGYLQACLSYASEQPDMAAALRPWASRLASSSAAAGGAR